MATPSEEMKKITWRRYEEGEQQWEDWGDKIFREDTSYKCPTYINRTPPCQGSCPSGHDIRGWLHDWGPPPNNEGLNTFPV